MKRLIAFILLFCLLLWGCQPSEPVTTEPSRPLETAAMPATETTEAATEATTEPTQTEPEQVTVYLLEKTNLFDSGYKTFSYDSDYNLDTCDAYNMDSNPWCSIVFDEKNRDGAAGKLREKWGEDDGQTLLVTYTEDGRLLEGMYEGSDDTGFRCEYDEQGRLTKVTDYYEGAVELVVYYAYTGTELSGVWSEDSEGNPAYDCVIENGRIVKKRCCNADGDYTHSFLYTYDEQGNLIREEFSAEGEVLPNETYTYRAVEVDADRARQLLRQQHQFLWILSQYVGL